MYGMKLLLDIDGQEEKAEQTYEDYLRQKLEGKKNYRDTLNKLAK